MLCASRCLVVCPDTGALVIFIHVFAVVKKIHLCGRRVGSGKLCEVVELEVVRLGPGAGWRLTIPAICCSLDGRRGILTPLPRVRMTKR